MKKSIGRLAIGGALFLLPVIAAGGLGYASPPGYHNADYNLSLHLIGSTNS